MTSRSDFEKFGFKAAEITEFLLPHGIQLNLHDNDSASDTSLKYSIVGDRVRHWFKLDLWDIGTAINMLCGILPEMTHEMMGEKILWNLEGRMLRHFRDDDERPQFWQRIDREELAQKYEDIQRLIESSATKINSQTPRQWVDWALSKDVEVWWLEDATRLGYIQDSLPRRAPVVSEMASVKWPWGSHETEALRHVAAAAERWWSRFDPRDPTTAPTNEAVSTWLMTERGVQSKRLADSIASILRADGLPTGPRG